MTRQLFPHSEKQAQNWAVFLMTNGLRAKQELQRNSVTEGILVGRNLSNYLKKGDRIQNFITTKMQDLQSYYQQEFSNFWAKSFPSKSYPPLPKKLDDLGLMEQLAMREESPELFQNLFKSDYSSMPVDVATRLRNNTLWAGDEVVLDKYGWTAKAKEMRGHIEEGRRLAMEKKIAETAERNRIREEQIKNKSTGFQGLAPLSQEQIMKARQEWGISP